MDKKFLERFLDLTYATFTEVVINSKNWKGNTLEKSRLIKSIKAKAENNKIVIELNDYYFYSSEGRKAGKRPPHSVILEWLNRKGIGTPSKRPGIAYAICYTIGKYGTRKPAYNFIDKAKENVISVLIEEISKEIIGEIDITVETEFDKLQKKLRK